LGHARIAEPKPQRDEAGELEAEDGLQGDPRLFALDLG
jgi:hypothetical protein